MQISELPIEEQKAAWKYRIPRELQNIYIDVLVGNDKAVEAGLKQLKQILEEPLCAMACMELRLSGSIDAYAVLFRALDDIQ